MSAAAAILTPETRNFYLTSLDLLETAEVPYLVGGAYAFARYTGIERHTKDFDLFIRRSDFDKAARAMHEAGYQTELTFPHWLGKAFRGDDFVDLIFSAGNGVSEVDDLWFQHAVRDKVFGKDVPLIPPEEMIWSKGLIMERERYDGADVAHVIRAVGETLDWRRLIDRYAEHWRVLFAHIILFGYVYPSERAKVPAWVIQEMSERFARETEEGNDSDKICYGTIISRQQYLTDINRWGYKDARLGPEGKMTPAEIAQWTAGIAQDGS